MTNETNPIEWITLKELAPYLPYKLKGYAPDIKLVEKITLSNVEFLISEPHNCKPLLRHLSDLTKEIEVNGERFVPIIELFKIGVFKTWNNQASYCFDQLNITVLGDILRFNDRDKQFIFQFQHDSFSMLQIFPRYEFCELINQKKMFEKLYEWHFDVFGLIDRGLAVNINDIQE